MSPPQMDYLKNITIIQKIILYIWKILKNIFESLAKFLVQVPLSF